MSVVVDIIAIVGIILSNVKTSAYYKVITECRKQKDLGSINPVPLAVSFLNQSSWLVYSCAKGDFYLLLSVVAGIFTSSYALISAVKLLGTHGRYKAAATIEKILLAGLTVWVFLATLIVVLRDIELGIQLMGYFSTFTSISNSASPFSCALVIMRTGDASSLYLPAITLNLVNGTLWVLYGLVTADYFLVLSSGIGWLLALLQVSMKLYFHFFYNKKDDETTVAVNGTEDGNSRSVEVEMTGGLDATDGLYDQQTVSGSQRDSDIAHVSVDDADDLDEVEAIGQSINTLTPNPSPGLEASVSLLGHAEAESEGGDRGGGDVFGMGRGRGISITSSAASTADDVWLSRQRAPTLLDSVSALLAPLEPFLSEEARAESPIEIPGRVERSTSVWGAGTGLPAEGVDDSESSPPTSPSADYFPVAAMAGPRPRGRSRAASDVNEIPFFYGA